MDWLFKPLIEIAKKFPYEKLTGDQVFFLLFVMLGVWAVVALIYLILYFTTKILTGGQLVGLIAMLVVSGFFWFLIDAFKDILIALDVVLMFLFYLLFTFAVVYFNLRTQKARR